MSEPSDRDKMRAMLTKRVEELSTLRAYLDVLQLAGVTNIDTLHGEDHLLSDEGATAYFADLKSASNADELQAALDYEGPNIMSLKRRK